MAATLTTDVDSDFAEAELFGCCVQTLNDEVLSSQTSVAARDDDGSPGYHCVSLGDTAHRVRVCVDCLTSEYLIRLATNLKVVHTFYYNSVKVSQHKP